MYRLSPLILLLMWMSIRLHGQSPHGAGLAMDCAKCHSPESWSFNSNKATFDHDSTSFPLKGQHINLDCRSCHTTLEFEKAPSDCVTCHMDIHQQTVGTDCVRCHTPESWIVDEITKMHEGASFPLIGVHSTVDCNQCHVSENNLRFNPVSLECVSCHNDDFNGTKSPDHIKNGFSDDCVKCHSITGTDWNTNIVDHSFFPLEQGHAINDCAKCHNVNDYSQVSAECISCHQTQFNQTLNPNHTTLGFSTDCKQCHTIAPDWKPADFSIHDGQYFPIYSGKHKGHWTNCTDCHTVVNDFSQVSCIVCHKNPATDEDHKTVTGYTYNDNACLACHPQGDASMTFDHNTTHFPLTGAHKTADCIQCHSNGYAGTSTACVDCHIQDYNQSLNPSHQSLGISKDCASCHQTEPGWAPAFFDMHNTFYALNGAHAAIENECATCHNGDYNNTPNTCIGCHSSDYNGTTDPNHISNQISSDCISCHTENEWQPSTFNHDGQYFPIYSGKHFGQWNQCTDCHNNPSDYTQNNCLGCHINPETNTQHISVSGYQYVNTACLACHPQGDADNAFNHDNTNFPLTGAHKMADCIQCHANGYQGTSTVCMDCHTADFNQTLNPNHQSLGFNKDCASCHTTAPGWAPATFDNHNDIYPLNGAHAIIANDCASCHNGNYNTTPNTCVGCHISDYTGTTNPNHNTAQFPTDCANCHSENAWQPATFNHDGQYFPIYSGKHNGQWTQCIDCHNNPSNYTQTVCITCHQNPETDNSHTMVAGYTYNSPACLACHPTGDADFVFNHNSTAFPLTGAHLTADCIQCHASGFQGTSTNCVDCHTLDYNQSLNPNHTSLGIPTDCASCHTTEPGWAPATFAIHNQYYALNGAHASVANDCASCHNGNYINSPNTCVGCHNSDYTNTTNPNHTTAQFPTDCASCHSENSWVPTTFNHDGQYFPIYSGSHNGQWTQCIDCHNNASNYSQTVCITCHQNPETNEQHVAVGGYVYNSPACLACHPNGESDGTTFNHNNTAFPLTGAHVGADCIQCHANGYQGTSTNCVDCHTLDFNQSLNPNHQALGFPTDCASCHTTAPDWAPATFAIHNQYYALNGAHASIANDCATCHNGDYLNTPNTCIGCHNTDYTNTTNPNHASAQFPTDCASCHSENAWVPTTFNHDGQYFPIYSGSHNGQWTQCIDCHSNPNNYAQTVCITCHQNPETNEQHVTVGGYVYNSPACLACHPNGEADGTTFNHNNTAFPLTGAHIGADCIQCHANGYQGTSTNCVDCHTTDYNQSLNPNHQALGLPTDCVSCHTTAPGWAPASFMIHNSYYPLTGAHATIANDCAACHNGDYVNTPADCVGCHNDDYTSSTNPNHVALNIPNDCVSCHTTAPGWAPASFAIHDQYYPLNGAHATIANQCATCHNGDYNNTPNTCTGCHISDYNGTTNPNHQAAMFPTDCASCHSESAWVPSTFDHDGLYFPIYSGAHNGEWNQCIDCHTNPNNYSEFTCITCHMNPETNEQHDNVGGYVYNSPACLACHPQGNANIPFNHNSTAFPLTGGHIGLTCAECHANGYQGTSTVCLDCHTTDYAGAQNPNHSALSIPTDCASCHTTAPGWAPATFAIHSNYYALTGAHAAIANDCAACHNGDYINTPGTCVGCHNDDYQSSTNPNHVALNIPNDCVSCHTTAPGWAPASFAIHNQYYPLNGAHAAIANQCATCHNGNYINTPNTCVGCHISDYNGTSNPDHQTGMFPTECATCHNESAWIPSTFNHNNYFPLTGAHASINDCTQCHIGGNYVNTPNECNGCHNSDYNGASNPNHQSLNLSTNCVTCHTTDPGWMPAGFPNHNDYYVLQGAHAQIADNCVECHNGNYINTPNTCYGCHASDYNGTNDPNHSSASFPTTCATCHSQSAWQPANWDHDDMYFPIYSGAHEGKWDQCNDCHTVPNNYALFNCLVCHSQGETNGDHQGVSGYMYQSTACYACHPDGSN